MAGQAHHRGRRYNRWAAELQRLATTNPNAICWICRKPPAEHPPRVKGAPYSWHAAHTIDGSTTWQPWLDVTQPPPAGDWLAAAASQCNIAAGNDARDHRHRTGYAWP